MEGSMETRIALLENEQKNIQEQSEIICIRISSLEKHDTHQAVKNQQIMSQLQVIEDAIQNKKSNINLWYPVGAIMLFEVIMTVVIPSITI